MDLWDFAELYAEANSKVRAEIDRALEDRLKVALAKANRSTGCGTSWTTSTVSKVAVAVRRELIRRLIVSKQYLEAELLLVARLAIVLRR